MKTAHLRQLASPDHGGGPAAGHPHKAVLQASADALARSPRATAQRQVIQALFGPDASGHRKHGSSPHGAAGVVTQRKFYGDGAWMQDIDDKTLLARFGSTTSSLWHALQQDGLIIYVEAGGSGGSYDFGAKRLQLAADWLSLVKGYVDSGTKHDNLVRATSALTHEMSHAHDHQVRKESPAGASRTKDDWVLGVLKTELRAWMKEARSGRENAKGKSLSSNDDDNDLIFSWIAVHYLINDGTDLLTISPSNNVVVGRLVKYYNDNRTSGASSPLADLLAGGLLNLLKDYAGQIRTQFTSTDPKLRPIVAKYMA
jgi:hypothetical protein